MHIYIYYTQALFKTVNMILFCFKKEYHKYITLCMLSYYLIRESKELLTFICAIYSLK